MEPMRAEPGLATASHERLVSAPRASRVSAPARERSDQLVLVSAAPPSWYQRRGKRALDTLVACCLLMAVAPVMVAIAIALRVHLGPGVLFRQDRIGMGGRPFTMLKFRTMLPDRRAGDSKGYTGPDRRRTHKHPNDPRHTPLGKLLRRTSLDELPQLLNVIRGDMALVGPRPEVEAVAHATGIVDHPRHWVRPGITGLWQVSPMRADAVIQDGLRLDAQYVSAVTFRQDLSILARTGRAVLRLAGS